MIGEPGAANNSLEAGVEIDSPGAMLYIWYNDAI